MGVCAFSEHRKDARIQIVAVEIRRTLIVGAIIGVTTTIKDACGLIDDNIIVVVPAVSIAAHVGNLYNVGDRSRIGKIDSIKGIVSWRSIGWHDIERAIVHGTRLVRFSVWNGIGPTCCRIFDVGDQSCRREIGSILPSVYISVGADEIRVASRFVVSHRRTRSKRTFADERLLACLQIDIEDQRAIVVGRLKVQTVTRFACR